jgi:DNA-binding NtrC family response regulator
MKQVGDNLSIERGIGLDAAVISFEQWFIWWSLERNNFNQSQTAEELKIHRNSLVNRIRDWGWAERVQEGHNKFLERERKVVAG